MSAGERRAPRRRASSATRCTRPIRRASSTSIARPVSSRSRAAPWPTSTASRRMLAALSSTPSFAAGIPSVAVGRDDPEVARDRELHARAERGAVHRRDDRAPGSRRSRRARSSNAGRNVSPPPCSSPPVSWARRTMSAPAQNATPSPVITTARRPVRLLEVAAQLVAELGVERVATLGPVDRRQPDVLLGQLPADHERGRSLSSRR